MKKTTKIIALSTAVLSMLGAVACKKETDGNVVKLTVWVSEADKPFATKVAEEFQKNNHMGPFNIETQNF